jgi:hypothetical protein
MSAAVRSFVCKQAGSEDQKKDQLTSRSPQLIDLIIMGAARTRLHNRNWIGQWILASGLI